MANTISVLIDVTVDKANQALGNFRKSIGDADSATGKFKAGAGAAFESVKANAGNLALAAGASLVAFGVKAVGAFQDTALAAGVLRDSLGLTAEEASKYIETAGDLGISVEALEATMGRMNRTAADTPGAFEAIGAELIRNADGSLNVNETFLSTVDALNKIPDASARASAAQKIFGRSWMDIAEMVGQGADGLRESLDSVEAGKILGDDDIEDARAFRDSLDALKGVSEELSVTVGSVLVPALTKAADATLGLRNAASGLDEVLGPVDNALVKVVKTSWEYLNPVGQAVTLLGKFKDSSDEATVATVDLRTSLVQESIDAALAAHAIENAAESKDQLAASAAAARERVEELTASMLAAAGQVHDLEEAEIALQGSVDDLADKYLTALGVVNDATASDREKAAAVRDTRSAQIDAAAQALALAEAYAAEKGAADGTVESGRLQVEKLREMQEKYPELRDDIQLYIDKLLDVPGVVDTTISADTRSANASLDELLRKLAAIGSGASAGSVLSANRFRQSHTGSRFEAGEAKAILPGQQVFVPDGPGRMYSPAESQRMMNAGGSERPLEVHLYVDGTFVEKRIIAHEQAQIAEWRAGQR